MKPSDLTLYIVNSPADMISIPAKPGDICIRMDTRPYECSVYITEAASTEATWIAHAPEESDDDAIYMAFLNTIIPYTDTMSVLNGRGPDLFNKFGHGEFKQTLIGAVHSLVQKLVERDSPYRVSIMTAAAWPLRMALSIRIVRCATVLDAPSYYIQEFQRQTSSFDGET